MTLTVQDPANPIATANSYQSLADARTLAALYKIKIDADDTKAEDDLINGFMYLQQRESDMCGTRTTDTQNTAYPRAGVEIRGVEIADNIFPPDLLIAQLMGAEAFGLNVNMFGTATDGREVASEKIDVIETSYFESGNAGNVTEYPRFESAIEPLLCGSAGSAAFNFIGGQIW